MSFEPATIDIRPRLLMSLDGLPGTGRTRFALTAPRPLWVIELDKGGLEGVLEDADGVEVSRCSFRKNLSQDDAKRIADTIEDDIIAGRDAGRTVIIDKATHLWQLFRLAEFGRLSKERSRNYEGVNTRMSELLQSFVETDTNLLLIHDMTDDYLDDKKVGVKRAGYNGVGGIVRHAATFSGGANGDPFQAVITKCTPAWEAVGMVLEGDDINFQTYAMNAVPQLDPSVWL